MLKKTAAFKSPVTGKRKQLFQLKGTWRDFSRVATASDPAAALINGDVKISGDTAPLMQLQTIVGDLDIDWEAPIVNAIGPVFGHQLAEVIRAITRTSGTTHRRMKRQLSEFILEEGRLSHQNLSSIHFHRGRRSRAQNGPYRVSSQAHQKAGCQSDWSY